MERPNRKLATIMFTDIAGYTEQMSKDEDKAFALIQKKRDLLLPLVKKREGKLIKEIGDGTLTRYFNADNAIDCARTFQSKTDTDLNVRVGIHTGEVIVDKEDVFGDVVNIASRLESIAVPGSILLSKETIDKLEMPDKVELVSLGLQLLKGVGRLVEVYAIKDKHITVPNPDDYIDTKVDVHSDDEVPSIAIIPFENKGADEDVFYAFGISADLISDCSGAGLIRVAGLKDIEKLDYANLKYEELSEKLLVRYIAQGTLWKMGDIFQLSVELYDTKDMKIVWSDRWQENWGNLPTIKENLSDGLLKVLDIETRHEISKEYLNPKAYELYLRGKYKLQKRTKSEDLFKAKELLEKSLEIDNNYLVTRHTIGRVYDAMGDHKSALIEYETCLKNAINLNDNKGIANAMTGIGGIQLHLGEYDKALKSYNKALTIRKQIGDINGEGASLSNLGVIAFHKGDLTSAIEYYKNSIEVQKNIDDEYGMAISLNNIGGAYLRQGNNTLAINNFKDALILRERIKDLAGQGAVLSNLGAIYIMTYDLDKAIRCIDSSIKINIQLKNDVTLADSYDNMGSLLLTKGEYNEALDYYSRSLIINKKYKTRRGQAINLYNIGATYFSLNQYVNAEKNLKKSIIIQKEIDLNEGELLLDTTTILNLSLKRVGKDYDNTDLYKYLKEQEGNVGFTLNYNLFQLLNDNSYLKKANGQINNTINGKSSVIRNNIINYPIVRNIMEEFEKYNKVND
jgi:tetratricopeptide (TPR) repeat protein